MIELQGDFNDCEYDGDDGALLSVLHVEGEDPAVAVGDRVMVFDGDGCRCEGEVREVGLRLLGVRLDWAKWAGGEW